MKNVLFYAYALFRAPLLMLASIGGLFAFWAFIGALFYFEIPLVQAIMTAMANVFIFFWGSEDTARSWGMIVGPLFVILPGIPGRLLRSIEKRTALGTLYAPR